MRQGGANKIRVSLKIPKEKKGEKVVWRNSEEMLERKGGARRNTAKGIVQMKRI